MFQASDFKLTTAGPSLVPQLAGTGLYQVMAVIAGIAVLAISAHIKIPFYPVPVTMQTLAVLAIGMTYGTRLGGATLLGYLGAGAVGAPVFAGGAGIAYMMGPTGGYLLGFFVAAVCWGRWLERGWTRSIAPQQRQCCSAILSFICLASAGLPTLLAQIKRSSLVCCRSCMVMR